MCRFTIRSAVQFVVLLAVLPLSAQQVQSTTLANHDQRLGALRVLAEACRSDSSSCTAEKVGPDESLKLPNGVESQVHYEWLRQAFAKARGEKPTLRTQQMDAVIARLGSLPSTSSSIAPAQARHQADDILRQVEFAAARPSWLQQQWDRLMGWLGRHLNIGHPGASAREWIRLVLEGLLFAIPLILLALWIARQVREDRIVPEFSRGGHARRQRTEIDWKEEAQRSAMAQEWREAIHALYWHSIAIFEEKRQWPVSRNRTPREYLALLEQGSKKRNLLREKTAMLEAVWYGHRIATEADFRRAEQLTEELALA